MKPVPLDHVITTPRFRLRAGSEADFPHLWTATRVPGFNDGMLWEPPADIEEFHAPLERARQFWKEQTGFSFTIESREEGAFIGRIGIRPHTEPAPDRWNIGFFTHPDHQGRGCMTEAAAAMLAFAFEHLEAMEVYAAAATWNIASLRVLEKIGMKQVGHIERGFQKRGQWVAEFMYLITRNDWLNSPT